MQYPYENLSRYNTSKTASQVDGRHIYKSPHPRGAAYGGWPTGDSIVSRSATPRSQKHIYPPLESFQPPITSYRHERPPLANATRHNPYERYPPRDSIRSQSSTMHENRAEAYKDHPKYRRDRPKKILDLTTRSFDDSNFERPYPRRARVHPRHRLDQIPSRVVENPDDALIVNDSYGTFIHSQQERRATLEDNKVNNGPPDTATLKDTHTHFAAYELDSSVHEITIEGIKNIDEILGFSIDTTKGNNAAPAPFIELPTPSPAVCDHIPRSYTPPTQRVAYPFDDHIEIQQTPLLGEHDMPCKPQKHAQTKDVRDRAKHRATHPELESTVHIPRSLRAISRSRTVGPVGFQDIDDQTRRPRDRRLDTPQTQAPRSQRGIDHNYTRHLVTNPEGEVDNLAQKFTSIKLEDSGSVGSRYRQSRSLPNRPGKNLLQRGRDRERQQIVEDARRQRWRPTAQSCRPGLQIGQEDFNKHKDLIMWIVASGAIPVELLSKAGISRECLFYAFTELGLQLPTNLNCDGLVPYAKAHEDGFDNEACKLRAQDQFRADMSVKQESDIDAMLSHLMGLSLSDVSEATGSKHATTY